MKYEYFKIHLFLHTAHTQLVSNFSRQAHGELEKYQKNGNPQNKICNNFRLTQEDSKTIKIFIWKMSFLENDLCGKVELVCESLTPCFVRPWSKNLVRNSNFEFHSLSNVCITKLIIIYSSNSNADNYSITRRLLNAKAPLFQWK